MHDKNLILTQIPELFQRQDSTFEQLQDLKAVATRLGMYDAADSIQNWLNGKGDFQILEGQLEALVNAVRIHLNGYCHGGDHDLQFAFDSAIKPPKKLSRTEKQEALNDRDIAIENRFEAWWNERSEMFKRQFSSVSIARELWEHSAELCKDISKV